MHSSILWFTWQNEFFIKFIALCCKYFERSLLSFRPFSYLIVSIKEEANNNLSTADSNKSYISYVTHPRAVYTSRLLDFNLPKPINSDDYYRQYDNISSQEYSGNSEHLLYY